MRHLWHTLSPLLTCKYVMSMHRLYLECITSDLHCCPWTLGGVSTSCIYTPLLYTSFAYAYAIYAYMIYLHRSIRPVSIYVCLSFHLYCYPSFACVYTSPQHISTPYKVYIYLNTCVHLILASVCTNFLHMCVYLF